MIKSYDLKHEEEKVYKKLNELLQDLKYGTITLVVQDGKVVQLNKEEKVRI